MSATSVCTLLLAFSLHGADAFGIVQSDDEPTYDQLSTAEADTEQAEYRSFGKSSGNAYILNPRKLDPYVPDCSGGRFGCGTCWRDYKKSNGDRDLRDTFCKCMDVVNDTRSDAHKSDLTSISPAYRNTCDWELSCSPNCFKHTGGIPPDCTVATVDEAANTFGVDKSCFLRSFPGAPGSYEPGPKYVFNGWSPVPGSMFYVKVTSSAIGGIRYGMVSVTDPASFSTDVVLLERIGEYADGYNKGLPVGDTIEFLAADDTFEFDFPVSVEPKIRTKKKGGRVGTHGFDSPGDSGGHGGSGPCTPAWSCASFARGHVW